MADLIDRDELMKKICGNECGSVCDEECEKAMCNFYDYIMEAPAVNRWIPCEDELPERDTNVLIYYPAWQDAPVQTAHIMSDGICWEFSDGEFYPSMKDITHWMPLPPLPEPPEKE